MGTLSLVIVGAIAGIALGLRYRVGALVAASLLFAIIAALGLTFGMIALAEAAILVAALQLGYLAGVGLGASRRNVT